MTMNNQQGLMYHNTQPINNQFHGNAILVLVQCADVSPWSYFES